MPKRAQPKSEKPKSEKPKGIPVKKGTNKGPKCKPDAPLDKKVLVFPGAAYKAPRYFGKSTIYTDMNKKSWRLKLSQGDLHEKYFKFGSSPRMTPYQQCSLEGGLAHRDLRRKGGVQGKGQPRTQGKGPIRAQGKGPARAQGKGPTRAQGKT